MNKVGLPEWGVVFMSHLETESEPKNKVSVANG